MGQHPVRTVGLLEELGAGLDGALLGRSDDGLDNGEGEDRGEDDGEGLGEGDEALAAEGDGEAPADADGDPRAEGDDAGEGAGEDAPLAGEDAPGGAPDGLDGPGLARELGRLLRDGNGLERPDDPDGEENGVLGTQHFKEKPYMGSPR